MRKRLEHLWLAWVTLPKLLFNTRQRTLFHEMRSFTRKLPLTLKTPLPEALHAITPQPNARHTSERDVRNLADVAALLDRDSPLGLCLRRSLTRYHFLRQIDVPVVLHFGAKVVNGKPDRDIRGHAWLTLQGAPYFESGENWQDFVVMLSYPQIDS
jgi:hypothetical protein